MLTWMLLLCHSALMGKADHCPVSLLNLSGTALCRILQGFQKAEGRAWSNRVSSTYLRQLCARMLDTLFAVVR